MAGILTPNLLMNAAGFILQQKNCTIYQGTEELFLGVVGNVFFGPAIINTNVQQISNLTKNPVESGVIVSDHKIKMPPVVTVDMAMPRYLFSSHIEKLEELYNDSIYVNIITKTDFYTDMVLTARPYTLNAKNVDRPIVRCRFEKVVRIIPEYLSVKLTANPFDAKTIAAGNKNPVAINYDVTTQSFIS